MGAFAATWLTEQRLLRLGEALCVLPPVRAALPQEEAVRAVWRRCGGSRGEVLSILQTLQDLGTIAVNKRSIGRTESGDRLSKAVGRGDFRPLGMTLVESGIFHEQGRILFEAGRISADGHLECPAKVARRGAAQLLAVLQLWPEVQTERFVSIPRDLVALLDVVWAIPPPARDTAHDALRKKVGDRAELFTYLLERRQASANPSQIAWVSRDSESLGWDVEDRSVSPCRRIEVKGSQGAETRFYLSETELNKAHEHGERYEVHFWGDINLEASVLGELDRLVKAGYPRVYKNPAILIDRGTLLSTPVRWRLQIPGATVAASSLPDVTDAAD